MVDAHNLRLIIKQQSQVKHLIGQKTHHKDTATRINMKNGQIKRNDIQCWVHYYGFILQSLHINVSWIKTHQKGIF